MNIMFLARSLNHGGAERQLLEAVKGLKSKGHSVCVAMFYGGGALEAELNEYKIPLYILNKKGRWDLVPFYRRLLKIVRDVDPEIIYGCLEGPNIFASVIKLFNPKIRVVWWLVHAGLGAVNQHWSSNIANYFATKMSVLADLIIINSYAGQRFATKSGYPRPILQVIQNGIDTDRFKIDRNISETMRERCGIKTNERIIALIARIDPVKGHRIFLEAASIINHAVPEVRFLIVGDGPSAMKNELVAYAEKLDINKKIIWLEAVNDIENVYNSIDILCLASLSEGLPNVVCEAMACGITCVVTDVGDAPDIVGELGYIAPPNNPRLLAEQLVKAIERQSEVDPKLLRSRIVEKYSARVFVDKTEQAMQSLFYINFKKS